MPAMGIPMAQSDVDRRIGVQIRSARLLAGMTERQLADDLAITVQDLIQFEGGSKRMPPEILVRAAKIFDVSLKYFF